MCAKIAFTLQPQEASAVLEYCRRELVLPEDLILRASGQKIREPFLVARPSPYCRTETSRMLAILESLWTNSPESFAGAAQGVRGHRRLWFSMDPSEIHASGSSNKCSRIGKSPWWVSTNCPWNGMTARIERIMRPMKFSHRYIVLVTGVVAHGVGSIWEADYLAELPKRS